MIIAASVCTADLLTPQPAAPRPLLFLRPLPLTAATLEPLDLDLLYAENRFLGTPTGAAFLGTVAAEPNGLSPAAPKLTPWMKKQNTWPKKFAQNIFKRVTSSIPSAQSRLKLDPAISIFAKSKSENGLSVPEKVSELISSRKMIEIHRNFLFSGNFIKLNYFLKLQPKFLHRGHRRSKLTTDYCSLRSSGP